MKSMTGFGAADGGGEGSVWRWELRSVNGRGLDVKLRLPPGSEAVEAAVRPLARQALARGSVSAHLSVELRGEAAAVSPDPWVVAAGITALTMVRGQAADADIPLAPVSGEALAALALSMASGGRRERPSTDDLAAPLAVDFGIALERLVTAREKEGARLARIIREQMTQIESLIRDAEDGAAEAVHVLRERTRRQVSELMEDEGALDAGRLEQEVAMLAGRADIREEIDRLRAHHAALAELVASDEPVGRRLDFLTQELNRETNTICAKSATDRLTRIGLDLKSVIEQLREQAANVE